MQIQTLDTRRGEVWTVARVTSLITDGVIAQCLDPVAREELSRIDGIAEKVAGALKHPKPLDIVMPVFNAVLGAQYYELFEALELPCAARVYEPCVGASNPVIVAAESYSGGAAAYLAINLNRKLRAQLNVKTAHLKMSMRIIEDNAERALEHLAPGSFDAACFHHAVNDILQTAVSEPRGLDTTEIDWFPTERKMIEWLAEDAKAGRLDARGKPELMRIVGNAVRLVKPGGDLIFDHFNWCKFIGVDWFPWDLFYNLIPMTRQWIAESDWPVTELRVAGVDPKWWMILRVNS
ncbi:MAG TPA: hypothetical protein VKX17_20035 [Planctomycetota bacterium]|nr:hypothetical protein [Planctomycetota bacterium]